jgi:hypothetical protein
MDALSDVDQTVTRRAELLERERKAEVMNTNNMADLMRQLASVRKDMESTGSQLKERFVEAESGGGLVEVVFNGQQELMRLSLDPKLFEPGKDGAVDIELIEDLVSAAVGQGVEKSKALMREEMDAASGGLGGALPGLF